mmetsp:Transcript_23823/g.60738  ORF Transcript_23823/g.60738 Transcript_23823/m.60738 type:complete len:226 (+) Transcript_23823:944-1621(+)
MPLACRPADLRNASIHSGEGSSCRRDSPCTRLLSSRRLICSRRTAVRDQNSVMKVSLGLWPSLASDRMRLVTSLLVKLTSCVAALSASPPTTSALYSSMRASAYRHSAVCLGRNMGSSASTQPSSDPSSPSYSARSASPGRASCDTLYSTTLMFSESICGPFVASTPASSRQLVAALMAPFTSLRAASCSSVSALRGLPPRLPPWRYPPWRSSPSPPSPSPPRGA